VTTNGLGVRRRYGARGETAVLLPKPAVDAKIATGSQLAQLRDRIEANSAAAGLGRDFEAAFWLRPMVERDERTVTFEHHIDPRSAHCLR
jgi:hypothetical protein